MDYPYTSTIVRYANSCPIPGTEYVRTVVLAGHERLVYDTHVSAYAYVLSGPDGSWVDPTP